MRRNCGDFPAGSCFRWGEGCVVVQTEQNPWSRRSLEAMGIRDDQETNERKEKAKRQHIVARTVNSAGIAGRQCPERDCHTYVEQTFISNLRGTQYRMCDNILPDGARCDQTTEVTVGQSFIVGFEATAGMEGVVSASGSFSSEISEEQTETLTTAITINCDSGSGYIVWYPLIEISQGECRQGSSDAYNEDVCFTETFGQCEMRRPVASVEGRLGGEYDVVCL